MTDVTKLLPIGTVVMLENGKKEVMITGFCVVSEKEPNTVFDYCGCLYPEGVISSEQNLLFNHKQIVKVLYLGFNSEKDKEFKQRLSTTINKMNSEPNNN